MQHYSAPAQPSGSPFSIRTSTSLAVQHPEDIYESRNPALFNHPQRLSFPPSRSFLILARTVSVVCCMSARYNCHQIPSHVVLPLEPSLNPPERSFLPAGSYRRRRESYDGLRECWHDISVVLDGREPAGEGPAESRSRGRCLVGPNEGNRATAGQQGTTWMLLLLSKHIRSRKTSCDGVVAAELTRRRERLCGAVPRSHSARQHRESRPG